MTCRCAKEWNADCPEHGVLSEWWNHPERVYLRENDLMRLRWDAVEANRRREAARVTR